METLASPLVTAGSEGAWGYEMARGGRVCPWR